MKKKQFRQKRKLITPKDCSFCIENKEPVFRDTETLQRYLTERGKIFARSRSGVCAMHQRRFEREVKYARYLALLPFTARE